MEMGKHLRLVTVGRGILWFAYFLPALASAVLPEWERPVVAALRQGAAEIRQGANGLSRRIKALGSSHDPAYLLQTLDEMKGAAEQLTQPMSALEEGFFNFGKAKKDNQAEWHEGLWLVEEKNEAMNVQIDVTFLRLTAARTQEKLNSPEIGEEMSRLGHQVQLRNLQKVLNALHGAAIGLIERINDWRRREWERIDEQILGRAIDEEERMGVEAAREILESKVGDFEALLLSLDTNSTEQYITCLLEDEEIVKSLWQALDTIDRDIYLLMAEFGLGDVGNPGNLDELNFLFEKKQSLERMVNALREKADSTEARELAARLGGAESKRRLRSRFVELSTLEVALADLFSKTEGFVGQRRVRRELRSEPGARNPRREERRRPAAGTGPDERQRIPAGAALAPPPPARPLAERPIGAQRAAPLASPAIMMQEKLKAISGFNLARLLHNLADHNPRSSDDFLSFMCSRIRIFYDAILRLDPDQLRDPISPERRLGDVHYGHYAVDGTAITISLMPETTGEGRHPFAVASVARWISLEDQRRLGEAFVGYYDRFCSPENLQSLNDLATYLEEAVASQLPPSIMPLLTEHHFFLHAQFLGSRWPHRHRAFSENMRQRRVRYGNHSIEFHPVIIAAYSLSVSLRALCQHLRDYPLRIIHRYIIDTPPGARLDEEIRRRSTIIESHGLSIQEVMMFMTNLDDALHLIDPLRLVAPATGR